MDITEVELTLEELLRRTGNAIADSYDDEFDYGFFCNAMKVCYEYFIKTRDTRQPFTAREVALYARLYAYTQLDADNDAFVTSTIIAEEIAKFILHPEEYTLVNDTISRTYVFEGKELYAEYNFNSGDFDPFDDFLYNGGLDMYCWETDELERKYDELVQGREL